MSVIYITPIYLVPELFQIYLFFTYEITKYYWGTSMYIAPPCHKSKKKVWLFALVSSIVKIVESQAEPQDTFK